ncbi:hypothetical protein FBF54_13560 [Klebsiella pneumoniae]|nr:hypothetical protein [Klebsiella pneumoniae]QHU73765.1 hypothetical protein FBF54_13560 [Klebsiella pneumoniae]
MVNKTIKKICAQILIATILTLPQFAIAKSQTKLYNGANGENAKLYGNSVVISGVEDLPSKFSDPLRCTKAQEKPLDSGIDGQGLAYDAYLYDCGNNTPILVKRIVDGQYAGKVIVIIIPNFRQIYLGRK